MACHFLSPPLPFIHSTNIYWPPALCHSWLVVCSSLHPANPRASTKGKLYADAVEDRPADKAQSLPRRCY